MKKIIAFLLLISLIICFSSCGKGSTVADTGEDITTVNIGFLSDVSALSIAAMMDEETLNVGNYNFKQYASSDMLISAIKRGKVDVALMPAEMCCKAYNELSGKVKAIDISAYNAFDFVSADSSIKTLENLKGKTLYIQKNDETALRLLDVLLEKSEVNKKEINIEYKATPEDVILAVNDDYESVAFLSQPYTVSACEENSDLSVIIDFNKLFRGITGGNIVSGASIVRNKFIKKHPTCVENYLIDHQNSVFDLEMNLDAAAKKAVSLQLLSNEEIAKTVIPKCSLAASEGEVMKRDLSNYINAIYSFNKDYVCGRAPADEFYHIFEY